MFLLKSGKTMDGTKTHSTSGEAEKKKKMDSKSNRIENDYVWNKRGKGILNYYLLWSFRASSQKKDKKIGWYKVTSKLLHITLFVFLFESETLGDEPIKIGAKTWLSIWAPEQVSTSRLTDMHWSLSLCHKHCFFFFSASY